MCLQPRAKLVSGDAAEIAYLGAAQRAVHSGNIGTYFALCQFGREALKKRRKRWLSGRAEHGCDMVVLHKLGDSRKARQEVLLRQSLRLVKNNHAVCNIVQLAAAAAAVRVERFKKLHGSRDNNGSIPVFAGKQLAILCGGQIFRLCEEIFGGRVVGENVFFAEKLGEHAGSLVNYRSVWNDVYHA